MSEVEYLVEELEKLNEEVSVAVAFCRKRAHGRGARTDGEGLCPCLAVFCLSITGCSLRYPVKHSDPACV